MGKEGETLSIWMMGVASSKWLVLSIRQERAGLFFWELEDENGHCKRGVVEFCSQMFRFSFASIRVSDAPMDRIEFLPSPAFCECLLQSRYAPSWPFL
jgi:hypothetical protein